MAVDSPRIEGDVAPGWSPVADAFRKNFEDVNELGAAVAVYAGGVPVVDLWGGIADHRDGSPWQQDTVAVTFSSTKGVAAICAHILAERGLLDIDAPVARYWPEFGQAGKESIPVRWILTHQCGLPFVDVDLTFDDLCAHEPVLRALETQAPLWEPGTHVAYHAVLFGHLVSEVVRRITGKTLGTFFAEEIAAPLGLHAWIGLPTDEPVALAHMDRVPPPGPPPLTGEVVEQFTRSITLGGALPIELIDGRPGDFNDRRLLAIELPASNMVTDARSLARFYGSCVGDVDGVRLVSDETVRRASVVATRDVPYFGWPEKLSHIRFMDFAVGFSALGQAMSATSFGQGGAGGSLGFGDLDYGIGFAYVMNRMDAINPDTRAASLVDAVRRCTDR